MKKNNATRNTLLAMVAGTLFGVLLFELGLSGNGIVGDPNEGVPFVNDHVINGLFTLIGALFISGLKALVVPLVFCALFLGVTSLADPSKLGKLGGKALGLYLITTAIAVVIAMMLTSWIEPGQGLNLVATGDTSFLSLIHISEPTRPY